MELEAQRRALLAAAAALALPGVGVAAGQEIAIGQIGPFTGTPVPGAAEIHQGVKAALHEANAQGGVAGRRLALFALDDGFQPGEFVRRFDEAMAHRPVALLSPMGLPTVQRMLDAGLLDRHEALALNAVPGAESLRSPGHARLFHIRASDHDQIERIVRHAATLGVTRMVVLCQDLSIGTAGLAVAKQAAADLGLRFAVTMTGADGQTLAQDARRAYAGQPQCVLVLGSPRFAAEGIAALRKAGYEWLVYALSYVSAALVKQLAGDGARGVALAQVFPNPNRSLLVLQQQFQAAMKRLDIPAPFTAFQIEGYVTGRVLVEALRRARALTPDGLGQALHALKGLNLGGFSVDFSQGNVGSHFVDIAIINSEGKLVY